MSEQEDAGFLPDTKTVTPEQEGAAVAKNLTDEQAKQRLKARLAELDINDPGAEPEARPEPKPEPKPEPTPSRSPTAAGAQEFAPELLARAREHGITASEAKEYGSPALLERAVAHMDRALSRRQPAAAPQPAAPAPEEEEGFPELPDPADEGQEWDPNLRAWTAQAKAAFEKERAENKQLKEMLNQVGQHIQRQEVEKVTAQWDGFFEKVPDEFKTAVGEGALADLEGTAAGDMRKEVFRTFLALQQNYQQSGQKAPSFKTLAERALRACAAPTATPSTPAATADEQRVRDAQGRFAAPPTSRRDSVNTSDTKGDKPPADPKLRDQWAMNRFRKNAAALWGEE